MKLLLLTVVSSQAHWVSAWGRGAILASSRGPMTRGGPRTTRFDDVRKGPALVAAAATEGGVAEAAAAPPKFDGSALVKYAAAISIQVGLLGGGLAAVDFAAGLFPTLHLPTPLIKALTGLLFGSLALKSRIASPLNNRRPDREAAMKNAASAGFRDRIMPSWTPPGVVFPIMWVLIVMPLRAFAATSAATTFGRLLNPASASLLLHLAVGDTWNTINNTERRMGVAVPGVALVWLSCLNAVRIHATLVSPAAGKALAVTLCWISIAACLIVDTWRINFPREHFYPRRLPNGSSQTGFSWGVLGGTPSETK